MDVQYRKLPWQISEQFSFSKAEYDKSVDDLKNDIDYIVMKLRSGNSGTFPKVEQVATSLKDGKGVSGECWGLAGADISTHALRSFIKHLLPYTSRKISNVEGKK